MDTLTKQQLLESVLARPDGPAKIAASMVRPFHIRLAYRTLPTKVLDESPGPLEGITTTHETVHRGSTWEGLEKVQEAATEHADIMTRALIGYMPHVKATEPFSVDLLDSYIDKHLGDGRGVIVLDARHYADVRKFRRDTCDQEAYRFWLQSGLAAEYKQKQIITVRNEVRGNGMLLFGARPDVGECHTSVNVEAIDHDLYRVTSEITVAMVDQPRAVYVELP